MTITTPALAALLSVWFLGGAYFGWCLCLARKKPPTPRPKVRSANVRRVIIPDDTFFQN